MSFEAAQLSNRVLAAQAVQYDAGLLFRGVALVRRPADVLDDLFGRQVGGPGISVSSSLLAGYDEPEILPSSSRQICLTGADVGSQRNSTYRAGDRAAVHHCYGRTWRDRT